MERYDYHQDAVIHAGKDTPVRVVQAGAGSGKTHTLIGCIQKWIEDRIEHPSRIYVVTFTRKAAAELQRRLSSIGLAVGYVGTIHSLAHAMLRRWGLHYTMVDEDDLQSLVQMVAIRSGLDLERSDVSKAVLAVVREIAGSKRAFPAKDQQAKALLSLSRGMMARHRIVFIDEILDRFLYAMGNTPGFLALVRQNIQALAWDEYQDSAPIEDAIRRLIAARNEILVGDTRQAIYGFRGGNSALLSTADGRHMEIVRNYRSTPEIVDLANSIYPERPMESVRPPVPLSVSFLECDQEPEIVAGVIAAELEAYGRITVLARTNREVDAIAEALGALGKTVFVASRSKDRFLQPFWRNLSLLARFLSDPSCDWVAYRVLRILRYPRLEEAVKLAVGSSLWTTVKKLEKPELLCDLVDNVSADTSTIFMAAERLHLDQHSTGTIIQDCDLALLGMTINDFGAWYSARHEQDQVGPSLSGVTLCTVHAAKGLEWDCVVVVGIGKTIPSRFGTEEEERAVLYVSLTRARNRLLVVGTQEGIESLTDEDSDAGLAGLFSRCRKDAGGVKEA